jgi:hypothetical protein
LADHLDEAVRQFGAELAARWEAVAELEALRTSAARVPDLVLDNTDGPSSLPASKLAVVELLEGRIDAATANGFRWGSCFTLVAAMSHFSEQKSELELLGSEHNVDLTEDETGALWT